MSRGKNDMIRTRFAPSPTGYLHIGGLRTALYSYLYAKKNGGKFILRLEDTDTEREVIGAAEVIYETLKEAGVIYDEGPDVGGKYAPYVQSQRKSTYLPFAQKLVENGGAYYCFCGTERLEGMRKTGATKYDKCCAKLKKAEVAKKLKANTPFVIRQNIPENGSSSYTDLVFGEIKVDNKDLEDGILIKSDGMPTYNFANVIDDYTMGINVVMRGVEYLDQTAKYNHIYKGLGWNLPLYVHMQPIMKDNKQKLSKRHGDASFSDFVDKGFLPAAIVNYIALLGWTPGDNKEKLTLSEMEKMFAIENLSKSPSIFDEEKMRWLNSLYIRELDSEKFYELAKPFLEKLDYLKELDLKYLASLLQGRCEVLSDVAKLTSFITEFENFDLALFENSKWKTDKALAKKMLPDLKKIIEFNFDDLNTAIEEYAAASGYKKGQVLWVFRIAITGSLMTPGGAGEMAKLLSKEECEKRLKIVSDRL